MYEIILPIPISANRFWRMGVIGGAARIFVSKEAQAYKSEVAWLCKAAGIRKPIRGRVAVEYDLYPARPQDWAKRAARNPAGWDDDVRSLDLDNVQKVLFDALKNIAFEDDKWIREIHARRMEPDGAGRVVVKITPLALPDLPQASLPV